METGDSQKDVLIRRLKARDGRQGRSPDAPWIGGLQDNYAFSERDYDELGIVGARRLSALINDSYASKCGRFLVIARDEYMEFNIPIRIQIDKDLYRKELWADGELVAKTRNDHLAVNWLVLKTKGAGHLSEPLLTQKALNFPDRTVQIDSDGYERPHG